MDQDQFKILIVDDDPFVRAMLGEILESSGHLVENAKNGVDALEKYSEFPDLDMIISDMIMSEMNGLELVREIRKTGAEIPIVILTVNKEISVALEAIRSGANDYLLKDENIQDTILVAVEKVMEKHRLKQQNVGLMEDLVQKNRELEAKNAALVELDRQKNEFLGIAAHDLRGPISTIIGLSDFLMDAMDGLMADQQNSYMRMINKASEGMLALLNDLLDVSVIKSGKLKIDFAQGDLAHLVEERIGIATYPAEKKNISINGNIAGISDIVFDTNRIAQAIDNLISNAIKYSPANSSIEVSLTEEDENSVRLGVRDEGPGIPEDEQSLLFGEFQRLTVQPTGDETSTGLGLAIVKKIIDAHGGTLEVDSREGEGSMFSFKLPKRADS